MWLPKRCTVGSEAILHGRNILHLSRPTQLLALKTFFCLFTGQKSSTPCLFFRYQYIAQHGKDYNSASFSPDPVARKQFWLICREKQEKSVMSVVSSHTVSHRLISHTRNWGSWTICPSSQLSKCQSQKWNPSLLIPIPPPSPPSLYHTNSKFRFVNRPWESGNRETHTVKGKPTR